MKRFMLFVLLALLLTNFGIAQVPTQAPKNSPCKYGNDPNDYYLTDHDNFYTDEVLIRENNGAFRPRRNQRFRELAAYLNHLRLPSFVMNAYIILEKSLVAYEPENSTHWGKAWFDHEGKIISKLGDENKLKADFKGNYKAVLVELADWRERYGFSPYVLYENEDEGKDVFSVQASLWNAKGCYLGTVDVSFYKLPTVDGSINLDNVDAGNEYGRVVLALCAEGKSDEGDYHTLTGGSAPTFPGGAADLRREWEAKVAKKSIFSNGEGRGMIDFKIGHLVVDYATVAVYPHLSKPEAVQEEHQDDNGSKYYHFVVKLPTYFDGHTIATYTNISCVDDKTLAVRMLRGSVERNFLVTISRDPKDMSPSLKWWTR